MRRNLIARIRRFTAALILSLLLSGCQSLGEAGVVASHAPVDISGPAERSIADDMVSRLAEHVAPGAGPIALKQDGSPFRQALESALKAWGYAIAPDQKTNGDSRPISIAYVVEPFEGQILARLSTSGVSLGRAYEVTATGASPVGPLSVTRRG